MPNISIPFTVSGNYTFDSNIIEFSAGIARLKQLIDDTNLLSHYKLNDNLPTTTVLDASSNGNDLNLFGINSEDIADTGIINGGLRFRNVSTEKAFKLSDTVIDLSSNYTIAFWYEPTNGFSSANSKNQVVCEKTNKFLIWFNQATGSLDILTNSGAGFVTFSSDQTTWNAGTKYYIIITWDGVTLKLFVNNVQQATTSSNGSIASGASNFSIGEASGNNFPLDGLLDDVRFYSVEISDNTKTALYNAGDGTEAQTIYYTEDPSVYLTTGSDAPNIINWSNFVVTEGSSHVGILGFQLSNNGTNWFYWNGSSWASATNEYNIEATINTNISTFPTTLDKIYVKTFLISNGTQETEIDNISISFIDNTLPLIDAGVDIGIELNGYASPFANATFSDPDGTIVKAEYKIDGEVDVWTEIPQGSFGTLLEAVQAFNYQFKNLGSIIARLQVTDNDAGTNSDFLTVIVILPAYPETVEEINIGVNTSDTKINIEVD
jgi:hypothetical protein